MVLCSCMRLARTIIAWYLGTLWGVLVLIIGFVSLPARALSALQREKWTEKNFQALQIEVENLLSSHKDLEAHLLSNIRERSTLESLLADLEDEHDKAIAKIELLEKEIHTIKEQMQNLKLEIFQLREIRGKGFHDLTGKDKSVEGRSCSKTPSNTPLDIWPRKLASRKTIHSLLQSHLTAENRVENEIKKNMVSNPTGLVETLPLHPANRKTMHSLLQSHLTAGNRVENEIKKNMESNPTGVAETLPLHPSSTSIDEEEAFRQRREAALSQSLFSALLSVMVGGIAWGAKDPCMPLVVALFVVVGMSLKSVIQLFSTIKNKPAADAVALLSLNWFILGNLTYPTLPRFARLSFPFISVLISQSLGVIGGWGSVLWFSR